MPHLDTVIGIEKMGSLHVSLRCDECGATYNGGNGSTKPGPVMLTGYRATQVELLRTDAKTLGWTGPMSRESTTDKCPVCSQNPVL